MTPPPWSSKKADQQGQHQPQASQAATTTHTPFSENASSKQQHVASPQISKPGGGTTGIRPAGTPQLSSTTLESPAKNAEPTSTTKTDYCPQVIPRDALKSGGVHDEFAPSLEELKERANTGHKKWTEEALRATDALIPLQNGTNRWYSQKGMTGFGTPRDVRGKHVHSLVDQEYPESAVEYQQQTNRFLQDKSDY